MTVEENRVVPQTPRVPRRTGAVDWVGWHFFELAGVGGGVWLAVSVHPLWIAVSVLVASGWVWHEVQPTRKASVRGGALTSTAGGGTDSASPAPVGGGTPGEEDTRGSA